MLAKLQDLKNHQGFMRYFKNTSWLFGEKILRMVVGLFVGIWVARYLGPERFGLFSYAQSFVGLFVVIATLGLDGIVVRELVKDDSKSNELIGTAFWLKVMGAILVLIILTVSISFSSNDAYVNTLMLVITSATIFQSFNVVDMYFQAKVLSKFVAYTNVISLLISSIIKIVLILNEASLIYFAWVVLFDSIVLALGFIYFFLKNTTISIRNLVYKKTVAIALLKDSWPLILSGIVVSIYMKIDQVMIKEMLNIEAVGQYAAAVRLSEAWYFIPMVISASLFPAIVNSKKISKELYYERLQKLYNLMVWMAIVIAIPMTFLSDWIVELLYGGQYNEAGSVLTIHIWSGVFVFLGVASGKWFVTENLQMLSFWRAFNGMVVNVALNFILIPKYGIQGAAIATLLSQCMAAYIFDFFNNKTKKMFFMKSQAILLLSVLKKGS
jgi:O-antigen/teichoic acid export membrane protein